MKKALLYIFSVLLLALVTISSTYAYFTSTTGSPANAVGAGANEFDVIYVGGTPLSGGLKISNSRSEDFKTKVKIKLAPNSAKAMANLYIKIDNISSVLASDKLVWEVVGERYNDTFSLSPNSGDFSTCTHSNGTTGTCQSGDKLYFVTNYNLLYDYTEFTLYIWIDAAKATNDVIGATFSGYVGAETLNVTGESSDI